MTDAPELMSMTRRNSIRPLMAAWIFVIVMLGVGVTWLSLSEDEPPEVAETTQISGENQASIRHDINSAPTENTANIVSDLPDSMAPDAAPSDPPKGLAKAPIAGLVIDGTNGPLPVLGPDGMVAWLAYARPPDVTNDDRPKIAIIITGIGLNAKTSGLAIDSLPGQIDLGFSPYGRDLQKWMDRARRAGHEGFLMIPAEPLSYPDNDPGPHTLLTGATVRDNLKKLDWLLSRFTGYVGVVNEMGSKFTTSEADMLPILEDLNGRGLMMLDSRATRFSIAAKLARQISMPRAYNNRYIDNKISASEIAASLAALENTARSYGVAIGLARAIPLSIREIEYWAASLEERGIQLVPVTAIANRQPIR